MFIFFLTIALNFCNKRWNHPFSVLFHLLYFSNPRIFFAGSDPFPLRDFLLPLFVVLPEAMLLFRSSSRLVARSLIAPSKIRLWLRSPRTSLQVWLLISEEVVLTWNHFCVSDPLRFLVFCLVWFRLLLDIGWRRFI